MTDDFNPEQYLPAPRVLPQPRQYTGSGDVEVYVDPDGYTVLITAKSTDVQEPVPTGTSAAIDPFLNMDFRCFLSTNGVTFNEGQVDYVTWNGLHWRQTYIIIPETEVPLTVTGATQYIHLVIPVRTNTPTINDGTGPFVIHADTGGLGTPFTYARTNIWQGPSGVAPTFLIGGVETHPNKEDTFRPLLASINSASGLMMHHAGAIALPQGYRPGFIHLTP